MKTKEKTIMVGLSITLFGAFSLFFSTLYNLDFLILSMLMIVSVVGVEEDKVKSYNEIKKELKLLWSIANSDTLFRWTAFKLSLSVFLYELRGVPNCPYHGYHHQSFWTGYCRECKEIPTMPSMEDICTFCGEEKAVLQRADPNGIKEIWSICWECDKYIDWAFEHSMYMQAEGTGLDMTGIKEVPDFDEWLFEKEKVYPKHEWMACVLKKKKL